MRKNMRIKRNNVVVFPDTSVLIRNPNEVNDLQEDGKNIVVIPWHVMDELDGLKSEPDIGFDAREAIRLIEENQKNGNPNLALYRQAEWAKLDFDRKKGDHIILATINHAVNKSKDFSNTAEKRIISADAYFRVTARKMFESNPKARVLEYDKDEADVINYSAPPVFDYSGVPCSQKGIFPCQEGHEFVMENQGVIIEYEKNGGRVRLPALKKRGNFVEIPKNIQAYSIKPKALNGDDFNWQQAFALAQLLDPEIKLVFLLGGAGTGKTLLAIASALEKKDMYRQIFVTRPMVHLGNKDNMGFMPGGVEEKMHPWLIPIWQSMEFIRESKEAADNVVNDKIKKQFAEMKMRQKIAIQPLDYIRGLTYHKDLVVIDEAQNLTGHALKTMITRAGEGAKMIFTGDLSQIDLRKYLTSRSAGLNFAANRLKGLPFVAITVFKEAVRSEVAKYATELL